MWVPCVHLSPERVCTIYEERPAVCRNYLPDSVCDEMASIPTESERIQHYAMAFDVLQPSVTSTKR